MRQKTDSAARLKILLPGSWNWVAAAKGRDEKGRVPESVLASSIMGWRHRIGAVRGIRGFRQVFVNE
jgi:hypothetical protein